jgi:hypothetical protein
MTKTRGEDHPETLTMMHNEGMALGDLNRHEESLDLFRKTVEKCTRVIGENDSLTLKTTGEMAAQLSRLKRNDEALDLQEKVFEKRSECVIASSILSHADLSPHHIYRV